MASRGSFYRTCSIRLDVSAVFRNNREWRRSRGPAFVRKDPLVPLVCGTRARSFAGSFKDVYIRIIYVHIRMSIYGCTHTRRGYLHFNIFRNAILGRHSVQFKSDKYFRPPIFSLSLFPSLHLFRLRNCSSLKARDRQPTSRRSRRIISRRRAMSKQNGVKSRRLSRYSRASDFRRITRRVRRGSG